MHAPSPRLCSAPGGLRAAPAEARGSLCGSEEHPAAGRRPQRPGPIGPRIPPTRSPSSAQPLLTNMTSARGLSRGSRRSDPRPLPPGRAPLILTRRAPGRATTRSAELPAAEAAATRRGCRGFALQGVPCASFGTHAHRSWQPARAQTCARGRCTHTPGGVGAQSTPRDPDLHGCANRGACAWRASDHACARRAPRRHAGSTTSATLATSTARCSACSTCPASAARSTRCGPSQGGRRAGASAGAGRRERRLGPASAAGRPKPAGWAARQPAKATMGEQCACACPVTQQVCHFPPLRRCRLRWCGASRSCRSCSSSSWRWTLARAPWWTPPASPTACSSTTPSSRCACARVHQARAKALLSFSTCDAMGERMRRRTQSGWCSGRGRPQKRACAVACALPLSQDGQEFFKLLLGKVESLLATCTDQVSVRSASHSVGGQAACADGVSRGALEERLLFCARRAWRRSWRGSSAAASRTSPSARCGPPGKLLRALLPCSALRFVPSAWAGGQPNRPLLRARLLAPAGVTTCRTQRLGVEAGRCVRVATRVPCAMWCVHRSATRRARAARCRRTFTSCRCRSRAWPRCATAW